MRNSDAISGITSTKDLENLTEPLLPISAKPSNNIEASLDQCSEDPNYAKRAAVIDLIRKVVGEIMASFVVVFTVCAVTVNTYGGGVASTLATSLIGGLAVMVTIFSLGHVSGAHINPAVTVAQTAVNHFPWRLAPLYVSAHLMGGTLASLAVELICLPEEGILLVTPKTTALRSLFAETLGGFLLLFVASSVYTDARAIGEFAGMAVGSIIAIDIMVVGPVSGGGVNPARALGPAFANWSFDKDVWVFVVGPIVGGLMGACLYRILRAGDSITRYKYVVHHNNSSSSSSGGGAAAPPSTSTSSSNKRLRQLSLRRSV